MTRRISADDFIVDGAGAVVPSIEEVGGKAHNLARLAQAGVRVPAWYAVTTELIGEVLPALDGLDGITADDSPERLSSVLDPVRNRAAQETRRQEKKEARAAENRQAKQAAKAKRDKDDEAAVSAAAEPGAKGSGDDT